jgi:large conductance mechanosensitive channel
MWQEYKAFLFRGNLLDLAVAFILGVAFNAVVQSFANDVIMAIVAGWFDVSDVEALRIGSVQIGLFLSALLSFVLIATVLFFVMRLARQLDRPPPEASPAPESDEVILLREIRDVLQQRR